MRDPNDLWLLRATCAAALLVLTACSPQAESPDRPLAASVPVDRSGWPADTVLALNGTPITAAEVDAASSRIARAEPHLAVPHLRRLALTNLTLPLHAARQKAGAAARDAALTQAQTWLASLRRGETPPAPVVDPGEVRLEGGFAQLGLEVWDFALDAEPGVWSEPIEVPGAWRLARVVARGQGLRPIDVPLQVDVRTFLWDPAPDFRQAVEALLDRSTLEYVDPSWRDLVPTLWQRRLRGTP
jgi:uncharacterized protein YbdZ (MbtH family)